MTNESKNKEKKERVGGVKSGANEETKQEGNETVRGEKKLVKRLFSSICGLAISRFVVAVSCSL